MGINLMFSIVILYLFSLISILTKQLYSVLALKGALDVLVNFSKLEVPLKV